VNDETQTVSAHQSKSLQRKCIFFICEPQHEHNRQPHYILLQSRSSAAFMSFQFVPHQPLCVSINTLFVCTFLFQLRWRLVIGTFVWRCCAPAITIIMKMWLLLFSLWSALGCQCESSFYGSSLNLSLRTIK